MPRRIKHSGNFFKVFLVVFGDAFAAFMGGTGGVARCHLHGLGMRYDTKIENENFSKNFLFSMKKNRLNFLESHILMKILYDL